MNLKLTKIFLYAVPFSAVIVSQNTMFPFIVGKYVFFRTVVALAAIFLIWDWALDKSQITNFKLQTNSKLFKNPLIIAVFIFAVIYIVSGFFGYNPSFSFWSNFERGEGGLQMFFLLVYFLLLTVVFRDEESWEKMFIAASAAALLVIGYGVGAVLGIDKFVGEGFCSRFAGSLGNSAYLGTYMLFAIFYALYLGFVNLKISHNPAKVGFMKRAYKFKNLKTLIWFGLAIIFTVFLLLSQTRGAFLGLGVAVILGLFYFAFLTKSRKSRWLAISLALVLVIGGLMAIKYRNSINISMPFCGGQTRLLDISLSSQNMQTRLMLWKQSIISFKEKPLFGWGMENFNVPFEKHYNPYFFEAWYDRAHNIFFDYLVMTGIFGFLSFVGIFIVYYWSFFKARNNAKIDAKQRILLFALPIAYLVQGLVLFDVLPIYINLFLFLAFASYKLQITNNKSQTNSNKRN